MSSSTSSSEQDGADAASAGGAAGGWRGFVRAFVAVACLLTGGFLAFAFLIEPYDTGRSPIGFESGVRPQGPRTAAPSRGRDPAFNAAVIGNSRIQLVSPEELGRRTGLSFVSLTAPALRPKEIVVLVDWFLRNRRSPAQALVIGIDDYWCTADPALPNDKPFPFWLFSAGLAEYLVGLLRYDVIEEVQQRLRYLLAPAPERARPDGYWDYESSYLDQGYMADPARRRKLAGPPEEKSIENLGPFPAAKALGALLAGAPAGLPVILLRAPVYATALPGPGFSTDADAACRAAFREVAERRPMTASVDMRRDDALARDPANFFDHTHYRLSVARRIETEIAATLAALRRPPQSTAGPGLPRP